MKKISYKPEPRGRGSGACKSIAPKNDLGLMQISEGIPVVEVDFLKREMNILVAVTLQDMKTRFGGSYTSYLVAVLWPFAHMSVICAAYLIVNRFAPIGTDPFIFIGTALIPYMLCLYPSRLVGMALLSNKPFLNYSVIRPHHLILSRAILELLNVAVVILLMALILWLFDVDMTPLSPLDAATALSASLFFGISLGFIFAIIAAVVGIFFGVFMVVFMIGLYVGSLAYVPDYLISSQARYYLEFNPVYCLIKWLRSAYYPEYQLLDVPKVFVLAISFVLLLAGLLLERLLRGKILGQ